jgi:hypothetical protein
MNTARNNTPPPEIRAVRISETGLTFDLIDGRSISVPLNYFPTLLLASEVERQDFEICGGSVYWPQLDCDLHSDALLQGLKENPLYVRKAYERATQRQPGHAA